MNFKKALPLLMALTFVSQMASAKVIHFSYKAPEGVGSDILPFVAVKGDFIDKKWDKMKKMTRGEDGVYRLELDIAPGRYRYNFFSTDLDGYNHTFADIKASMVANDEKGRPASLLIVGEELFERRVVLDVRRQLASGYMHNQLDDLNAKGLFFVPVKQGGIYLGGDFNEYSFINTKLNFIGKDYKAECLTKNVKTPCLHAVTLRLPAGQYQYRIVVEGIAVKLDLLNKLKEISGGGSVDENVPAVAAIINEIINTPLPDDKSPMTDLWMPSVGIATVSARTGTDKEGNPIMDEVTPLIVEKSDKVFDSSID